jgi:hypothetical protein
MQRVESTCLVVLKQAEQALGILCGEPGVGAAVDGDHGDDFIFGEAVVGRWCVILVAGEWRGPGEWCHAGEAGCGTGLTGKGCWAREVRRRRRVRAGLF